jgi:hypothetical protein
MSTKTTFKRIALVAVAALGLGVLSVAPSQATISGLTTTVVGGTSAAGASDSTTAATITVTGFVDNKSDTITVQFIEDGARPTAASGYTAGTPKINVIDTATASTVALLAGDDSVWNGFDLADSAAVNTSAFKLYSASANRSIGAKFGVQLDSITALLYGTYNYTLVITQYNHAAIGDTKTVTTTTVPFAITVAKPASASKTISVANSTAYISGVNSASKTADTVVTAVATADTTADGYINITMNNASGTTGLVQESITATVTGAGVISFDGTNFGKSITHAGTAGAAVITVRGDGTAGVGTIAISTPNGFTSSKTITFYAKGAKTFTAKVQSGALVVGSNDSAVAVTAVDSVGTVWGGQAYIYAATAADALIGGSSTTPVACVYVSSKNTHWCPITTIAGGTANFKIIDAADTATATATSDAVAVTVSAATPATVKLEFDKASYQPFEKAYVKVSVLDAAGKPVGAKDYATALASGGISTNIAFSGTAPDLTSTTVALAPVDGTDKFGGYKTYVVYMPAQGDVTISATGGSLLPVAGQVKVSATASVVNSSVDAATDAANEATDAANAATDAALAAADAADAATAAAQDASDAVAALSATVAKLVASLKAQITSLTNLVIKIQKKVKA